MTKKSPSSKRKKPSTTVKALEDVSATVKKPKTPVEVHLRDRIQKLESETKNLRKEIGKQEEFNKAVAGSLAAEPAMPRFKYKAPRKNSIPVVPVFKLSDWHIGEVVDPNETEGFNEFNWEIAQSRLYTMVESFLQWVEIHRSQFSIKECALFCEGDYISGDIHRELTATNEFPVPVQTAKSGLLLGEVYRIIASHFDHVHAYQVGADNHGRMQPKPQAKQKTSNNMSYLVHVVANERSSDVKNLSIHTADGIKYLATVNGYRFLIEHGDTVKAWAGIPYYGFGRMLGKEATKRMTEMEKGFHFWSLAHFHVPSVIEEKMLVNGSLSGTSEFDHSCGRHARPAQVGFLVHPDHGIFNWTPFHGK